MLLPAALVLTLSVAIAQRPAKPVKKEPAKPAVQPAKPSLEVALGTSSRSGGEISKAEFDALARQGIHLKAAPGAHIEGFSFTYGERNMYEDSLANPILVTDFLTEYCMGDTLSPIISQTIASRTKAGDTAYYDDIHVRLADGKPTRARSMKFVITK